MRIREAQKHTAPTDPDPHHCLVYSFYCVLVVCPAAVEGERRRHLSHVSKYNSRCYKDLQVVTLQPEDCLLMYFHYFLSVTQSVHHECILYMYHLYCIACTGFYRENLARFYWLLPVFQICTGFFRTNLDSYQYGSDPGLALPSHTS
jgi:hypothetical protein